MLFYFTIPDQSPPHHVSDELLARQAQQQPGIFGQLYERHADRIYAYCLARTGSPEDAQDLTSEVFLAALENLNRYDSRRSFAGWLYGIAHHKVADHFRHRRRTQPIDSHIDLVDPAEPLEMSAEHHIQVEVVMRNLKLLGTEQIEALTLRIFAGLSTAETGLVMGKSEAAVKMLVYRALHSLQDRLAPHQEVNK